MSLHTVGSDYDLQRAFARVGNGDTIRILGLGPYSLTPREPVHAETLYCGGAPLFLDGKEDVLIEGVGMPTLQAAAHGSLLARRNCSRVHVKGIRFTGMDYIKEPKPYYFALVLYDGGNQFCDTTDCIVTDSGDHGIAELHLSGPSNSDHCTISRCQISRCGMLVHPTLAGDGAGIAMGGCGNVILHNQIDNCIRGVEIETSNAAHPTCNNLVAHNEITGTLWQAIICTPEHGVAKLFSNNEIISNTIVGRGKPSGLMGWGSNEHAITINGGTSYRIEDNYITNLNDWCGIEFDLKADLADSQITGNTISHVGRGGIWAKANGHACHGLVVRDNVFFDIGGPGIWLEGEGHVMAGNIERRSSGKWKAAYLNGIAV